jgi:hypothetical protein
MPRKWPNVFGNDSSQKICERLVLPLESTNPYKRVHQFLHKWDHLLHHKWLLDVGLHHP